MGVFKYPDLDTTKYKVPTILEESNARDFVFLRDEYARLLGRKILDVLHAAADELIELSYKYDIDGKDFTFDSYESLEREVERILDEAEGDILDLIEEYATKIADNDSNKSSALLAFLATLGNKGRNMQETLHMYMNRFRDDIEAVAASFKFSDVPKTTALSQLNSNLTHIQDIPAVEKVRKNPLGFSASLVKDGFIHYDPDTHKRTSGVPTNGSQAVVQMATMASQFVWQKWQLMDFADKGSVGYYQMRSPSSHFDCPICDEEVGFHLGNIDEPFNTHSRCRCLRIPIFSI